MNKLAPYLKAVAAFLAAGAAAAGTALADGHITPAEWCGVAVAVLGTTGAVYAVPNKRKTSAE
jgi:hypothetical protein